MIGVPWLSCRKYIQMYDLTFFEIAPKYPLEYIRPYGLNVRPICIRQGIGHDYFTHGRFPLKITPYGIINPFRIKEINMHIPGVKNIIAIASGKGGVGKSTVTTNMAFALASQGARVGILDADIYGPSQPLLLGLSGKPEIIDNKMQPLMAFGIQVMSIGFLVDTQAAMIWHGPMVSGALMQLLNDTAWDKLDYLFLDLPPGNG